jgi:hypothetical protein
MEGKAVKDPKKPAVYLETSFINRLADPLKRDSRTRQEQLDSRDWWRDYRNRYVLAISQATIYECTQYSNARIVRLRMRYLAKAATLRVPASELNRLAGALRRPHGPLPAAEILDAGHIAAAAISGCRFLLTWNQKHIANPFTRDQVDNIVRRHGYQTPLIATPRQFLQAAAE